MTTTQLSLEDGFAGGILLQFLMTGVTQTLRKRRFCHCPKGGLRSEVSFAEAIPLHEAASEIASPHLEACNNNGARNII
jgi:hypothetical protein